MQGPAEGPVLALCGSNLTGDAPFSCCLSLPSGQFTATSPIGSRGDLAALAADLCAAHGIKPAELAQLRIDLGPGSYTGLRVAITFVRFVQRFAAVPVLACDSLLLLADAGAAGLAAGASLRPLLDARRGVLHCATVRCEAGVLGHVGGPAALPFDRIAKSIAAGDRFVTTQELEQRLGGELRQRGAEVFVARGITAAGLFSPRLPMQRCDGQELEPRYLMGTYADEPLA